MCVNDLTIAAQRKLPSAAIDPQLKDWQNCMAARPRSADTDMGKHRRWRRAGIRARIRNGHKPTVDEVTSWANSDLSNLFGRCVAQSCFIPLAGICPTSDGSNRANSNISAAGRKAAFSHSVAGHAEKLRWPFGWPCSAMRFSGFVGRINQSIGI